MKHWLAIFSLSAALFTATPSFATEHHSGLLDRWYGALLAVEREEISALLSPEAKIELKDIGVTQTSSEFVASLDEWADAIKGGSIRHKVTADTAETVTVSVCYTFTSSAMLTTEIFVFAGKQIISSVQETVATNCDSF